MTNFSCTKTLNRVIRSQHVHSLCCVPDILWSSKLLFTSEQNNPALIILLWDKSTAAEPAHAWIKCLIVVHSYTKPYLLGDCSIKIFKPFCIMQHMSPQVLDQSKSHYTWKKIQRKSYNILAMLFMIFALCRVLIVYYPLTVNIKCMHKIQYKVATL